MASNAISDTSTWHVDITVVMQARAVYESSKSREVACFYLV